MKRELPLRNQDACVLALQAKWAAVTLLLPSVRIPNTYEPLASFCFDSKEAFGCQIVKRTCFSSSSTWNNKPNLPISQTWKWTRCLETFLSLLFYMPFWVFLFFIILATSLKSANDRCESASLYCLHYLIGFRLLESATTENDSFTRAE